MSEQVPIPKSRPKHHVFDIGGRKIRLFITHDRTIKVIQRKNFKGNDRFAIVQATTTAKLTTDDHDVVSEEHTHCSIDDQFIRRTGTRTALTRLMNDPATRNLFGLTKPVRTLIWNRIWNKGQKLPPAPPSSGTSTEAASSSKT